MREIPLQACDEYTIRFHQNPAAIERIVAVLVLTALAQVGRIGVGDSHAAAFGIWEPRLIVTICHSLHG